jgi:aspartate aminotransferase
VVAAPGSAFGAGGEGHIRFSFANSRDRLEAGLDRFESMVRDELEAVDVS